MCSSRNHITVISRLNNSGPCKKVCDSFSGLNLISVKFEKMKIAHSGSKNDQQKFTNEVMAAFIASLSIFSVGLHYAWPSPTLPKLFEVDSFIQITGGEGSWLAVAPLITAIGGAYCGSYLVDIIGRRNSILATTPFYILSWLLIALAPDFKTLIIGRLSAGFADGLSYTAIPVYIGEVASSNIRGLLGSFINIALISGQLTMNVIGPYVTIPIMAIVAILFPIMQLSMHQFLVSSPYFCLMQQRDLDALNSLKKLRGKVNVDDELVDIRYAVKKQMNDSKGFMDLFINKNNRKALLIVMGLRTIQQLSGISTFVFYTQYIFSLGSENVSPATSTIVFTGFLLVLSIGSSFAMDRIGRRLLFGVSCAGSAIILTMAGTFFYFHLSTDIDVAFLNWIPIAAMLSYVFFYMIGLCNVPMIIMVEMFPTNIKGKALGFMDMYFSLIVTIITKVYQYLADEYGMFIPFYIFAMCCVLGIIFAVLCVPETRGKTLEEIQMWLRNEEVDKRQEIQTISQNVETTKL